MKKIHGQWKRFVAGILAVLFIVSVIPQQREVQAAGTGASDVDKTLAAVSSYVLENDGNPDFESTWNMVGLVRSGMAAQPYKDAYYKNTVEYAVNKGWKLHSAKYTEYSKMIVALTALGKDARNIEGHNLLGDLSDFKDVSYQGFNGPIWALIALKSNPAYKIPVNAAAKEQTTEERLIQCILDNQLRSGAWNLACNEILAKADSDMTGMAIQALSSYYGKRDDVTKAVDKALNWISENQFASGGFGTPDPSTKEMTETCESTVQIIVALSSLGIDVAKDSRFIKNGNSPLDGLVQYYLPGSGFSHLVNDSVNGMATEQGLYAMAAYKRLVTGQTALYDMSEYMFPAIVEEPTVKPDQTTPGSSAEKPGTTTPGSSTEKPDTTKPDNSTQKPDTTKPDNSTQNPGTTKPVVNTRLKLQASKTSTTAIALKWNKISNAKGYVVENYNSSKKKYEKVVQLGATKTGHTFKGLKGKKLTSGTVYKLRVRAIVSVNGKNTYKQTETVVTATKPDRVSLTKLSRKSSSKARITWKKVKRSTGYEIYMSAKKKSGYKKIKAITKNKTVSYTKTKLKKGNTYYVKVRAYQKAGSKKVYGDFSKVKSIKMK